MSQSDSFNITFLGSVPSTNDCARELARSGAPEWTAVAALSQSAGRGRLGRSFFSPPDTGLYLSVIVRRSVPNLTAAAAVAAARAIERISGREAQIKWVNDVLIGGKKVAGILCESGSDGRGETYTVVGVGVNVFEPRGGFPTELPEAGAVFVSESAAAPSTAQFGGGDVRRGLAELIIAELSGFAYGGDFMGEYRSRSSVLGRDVSIITAYGESEPARAIAVSDDGGLVVRTASGVRTIVAGDVSVRNPDGGSGGIGE